jgi:hypothetical protein
MAKYILEECCLKEATQGSSQNENFKVLRTKLVTGLQGALTYNGQYCTSVDFPWYWTVKKDNKQNTTYYQKN